MVVVVVEACEKASNCHINLNENQNKIIIIKISKKIIKIKIIEKKQ